LIVHMSSPIALSHARKAQSKALLPVHAETCPHYMYLLSSNLAATSLSSLDEHGHSHETDDEWAGARHVCAPPLRHTESDLQTVWDSVNNGTITVISSDHAPTLYNSPDGKRKPLVDSQASNTVPTFAQIPNGLPGLETRLPILFSAATSASAPVGRQLSLPRFVELTSTNPARMYGLAGKKGSIAPGYDADLVIWYPKTHADAEMTISNNMLHHCIDYTPFEGMKVCNWPRYVVLRGEVKWDRDVELKDGHGKGILGQPTDGLYLKRGKGEVLVGRLGQTPAGMLEGERNNWIKYTHE